MPENDSKPLIGVDIGGTAIKVAVCDGRGRVRGRGKAKTGADEGTKEILRRIERAVSEACEEAGIKPAEAAAAGVAAPGAVDPRKGLVLEAVNLDWVDYPLQEVMEDRLKVPVAIENDVTAATYGEYRFGAGEQAAHLLGVWLGTGIGGGLILGGKIYHGHFSTAGEIGRGYVLPWAPPGSGSLDQVCSRTGVAETIRRLLKSGRSSRITELCDDLAKISSKDIAKAVSQGDELVMEVVDHAAGILGTALGGVVTFLSLGRIVIGGGFAEALGDAFLDAVRAAARKTAFPDRCKEVQIVASRLGDDAGPIGAAIAAIERIGHAE